MRQRILLVDDDRKIVGALTRYFEHAGFDVACAFSGAEALAVARATSPDLVVLDVMLPKGDGLSVCRALRAYSAVPIMLLTARTEEEDRLRGLELGADDYVTKPFSPREVVARARAILRRTASTAPRSLAASALQCGDVAIDIDHHQVTVNGQTIAVTPTEFRLLIVFVANPERVYRRDQLADRALDGASTVLDRTVDAHIMNLRRKIAAAGGRARIATVFGAGYKMVVG